MLECHHIVFRSAGGDDTLENTITLCSRHHQLAQTHIIPQAVLWAILSELYGYKYDFPASEDAISNHMEEVWRQK